MTVIEPHFCAAERIFAPLYGKGVTAMLCLTLAQGEYLTIGTDVVVQFDRMSGDHCKLVIQAPREIPVLRGEVLERSGGQRPACVFGATSTRPDGGNAKSPGTAVRPRRSPLCALSSARWTAGTATSAPCGGSSTISSPPRPKVLMRFQTADEPDGILSLRCSPGSLARYRAARTNLLCGRTKDCSNTLNFAKEAKQ